MNVGVYNGLRILYANVQGIRNKTLEFETLLRDEKISIFCISEHWLVNDKFEALNIPGYRAASGFCRSENKRGGVAIYTMEGIDYESLNIEGLSVEMQCEVSGIFLKQFNLQVVTVYRSPSGVVDIFAGVLSLVLDKLSPINQTVVAGDFNVHFENVKDLDALDLCSIFSSYALSRQVYFSTRLNACIDNIFADQQLSSAVAEKCELRAQLLSDHDGIIFSINVPKRPCKLKKELILDLLRLKASLAYII